MGGQKRQKICLRNSHEPVDAVRGKQAVLNPPPDSAFGALRELSDLADREEFRRRFRWVGFHFDLAIQSCEAGRRVRCPIAHTAFAQSENRLSLGDNQTA
jgi:hypothetical protein